MDCPSSSKWSKNPRDFLRSKCANGPRRMPANTSISRGANFGGSECSEIGNIPYLTLDPAYEAVILRVFAEIVEKDLVYQSKKPVFWSTGAQTALAEAEVEYKDRTDPSIYVGFPDPDRTLCRKGFDRDLDHHTLDHSREPGDLGPPRVQVCGSGISPS